MKLNTTANPAPKAGDEYKVVICGSNLTAADDNSFLAIKVLGFELEPITVEDGTPPQNSCGIAKGEKSKYVIKVAPASIPDKDISWSAVNIGSGIGYGSISFPDGNKGRSVNIKGDELGLAKAKVTIAQDCNHLNKPTIEMEVLEKVQVKVSVYVTFNDIDGKPARSKPEILELIAEVNKIYAQLAVEFVLEEKDIHFPISSEYFNLKSEAKYKEMQSIGFNTEGVEIYFVHSFAPWRLDTTIGLNFGDPGTNKSAGLTISRQADAVTLAHEIGHCGRLEDIYDHIKDQQLPNDLVKAAWEPRDWNSGPDPAYYERTLMQSNLIKRLLMYGYDQLDNGTDIANGQVWGIDIDGNPARLIPVGKENFMPMTRKPYHW